MRRDLAMVRQRIATVLALLLCVWGSQGALAESWSVNEVGNVPNNTQNNVNLKIDSQGQLHLSYLGTGNVPMYATKIGDAWSIQSLSAEFSEPPAMALDSSGAAHIVWTPDKGLGTPTQYAVRTQSGWSMQAIPLHAINPSLAIDGSGVVHLTYLSGSWPTLKVHYATYDGVSWSDHLVASPYQARGVAIALDQQGKPRIAFGDGGKVMYGTLSEAGWSLSAIDAFAYNMTGVDVDVAIDTLGTTHFVYTGSTGQMRYAEVAQGQTTAEVLTLPVGSAIMMSLALDSNDVAHVMYTTGTDPYNFKVFDWTYDGTASALSTILNANGGMYGDIVVGADGAHAAFLGQFRTHTAVLYAEVPEPASIALLAFGVVGILKRRRKLDQN